MKHVISILIIIFNMCFINAQDLKYGLEQYWNFNNGLDGVLGNKAVAHSGIDLREDSVLFKSASFSSDNSFLHCEQGVNFFNYFTLALWVKPIRSNAQQIVFTQKNNKREFTLLKQKDEIKFILQDEFGYKYQAGARYSFVDDRWYFICIVMEGTQCSIYVNNKLALNADRIKLNIRNLQTADTLFIGNSQNKQNAFRGAIDEIMVYNRPLSALEMDMLFSKKFPDFVVTGHIEEPIRDPIYNRQVVVERSIEISQPKVVVEYWDDEKQDDDIISLIFNDQKIVSEHKLTLRKQELVLDVKPGYRNRLVLIAENLGTIPPNTAKVKILCGKIVEELRLKSDLEKSAALEFIYSGEAKN